MNMFKSLSIAVIAALSFGMSQAQATELFDFTFSGPSASGSGTLVANPNGDGTFTVISGSGTETVLGASDTLTLLLNPNGISFAKSPNGIFLFNDQLFPTANPLMDQYGLLFATSSGTEVNIWGTDANAYIYANQRTIKESTTFSLNDEGVIPEPASIALLGLGLLAFTAVRRKS
ncbi:PEP-CTERM sorting domain-containing protein [Sapientia aquatica]|uniref:PEP-CTERM sorting domain-containing protein n=1 Tax=Sapientia aquatica TaxID=1549640 RepID=A0A4R5W5G0_9BURK|nr:PEP-CTERM sorting domain-containing protein [Sapientia aquatica]TDK68278.1 PEP-CTERM sorting domain-containing protein [Sapientia aquatica]